MNDLSMNTLLLNADWSQRCVVNVHTLPWQPSPSPLVHRRLLERNGGEVARATSIVRYAAGAKFDWHEHGLGEEILVLSGTLSDEFGDYGPGTYLKNPPGSSHAPFSEDGCTLLVKLRHLSPDDSDRVVVHTHQSPWFRGMVDGLMVMPLSEFGTTHTAMVRWAPPLLLQQRERQNWKHRYSMVKVLVVVVVAWARAQQAWQRGLVQGALWQGVSLKMTDWMIPEPRSERLHRRVHPQAMRQWAMVGRLQGPYLCNLAEELFSEFPLLL
jgi:hypothetical protein